jgi:hypothetical protein
LTIQPEASGVNTASRKPKRVESRSSPTRWSLKRQVQPVECRIVTPLAGQHHPGVDRLFRTKRLGRLDLDIGDPVRRRDPQMDLTVEARVGQIVDLPAEGRNLRVLGPVDPDGHEVVAVPQMGREARLEGGVAVAVAGNLLAVHKDQGVGHGSL